MQSYRSFTFLRSSFCLLFLFISFITNAANETVIQGVKGTGLVKFAKIVNKDQWFSYMVTNSSWPSLFKVKESNVAVELRYEDSKRTYNSSNWSVVVTYDVVTYAANGAQTNYTNQTLSINYQTTGQYLDKQIKRFPNAHKAVVSIVDVQYAGTPPNMLDDLFLDVYVNTERYYTLSGAAPAVLPSVGFNASAPVNNELPLSWNYVQGAENYDVEWLFLDYATNAAPPYTTAALTYDFRNATRINTTQQHYEVSLAYPSGILLYRVRAIGYTLDASNNVIRKEGPWSYTSVSGNTNTVIGTGVRYDYAGLDKNINWQYSAVFAEDGKRTEVISYFDGSLYNRQTLTVLNSDKNAVIGETKYDYQGRPTVQLLPAPIAYQGVKYHPNFNPVFDRSNFDTDVKIGAPDPMSSTLGNGTAVYYSPNNPNQQNEKANIPDAEGYPYSQVRYTSDGTGRIHSASGVGPDHTLGSNHETKYFYGTPATQEELDRLFGSEVGYVHHYKKDAVQDANGQMTVSYRDQEGRVIATALSGPAPANLLTIDNKPPAALIEGSLLGNNKKVLDNYANISTQKITVSSVGTYSFSYNLNYEEYCDDCLLDNTPEDHSHCKTCMYDLLITIKDADGAVLYQHTTSSPVSTINNYSFSYQFTSPGVYEITKTLSLNKAYLDTYLSQFEVNANCIDTKNVELEDCNTDCSTLCAMQYTRKRANGTTYYVNDQGEEITDQDVIEDLITACTDACNVPHTIPDECELKKRMLLLDMSPGGQYFDNTPDEYVLNSSTGELDKNPSYNWKEWLLNIKAENSTTESWFQDKFGAAIHNWEELKANFNPAASYTLTLLELHPEYCAYEYNCLPICELGNFSIHDTKVYEQEMLRIHTDAAANTVGYLNPLDLTVSSTHSGQLANNNSYIPYNSVSTNLDPIVAWNCKEICYKDAAGSHYADTKETIKYILQNYLIFTVGSNTYKYSIWYLLDDPDNIHGSPNSTLPSPIVDYFQQLHGDGTSSGLIGTGANQISKYDYFRGVYSFYKSMLIYTNYYSWNNDPTCLGSKNYKNYAHPDLQTDADGFQVRYPHNELFDSFLVPVGTSTCVAATADDVKEIFEDQVASKKEFYCNQYCEGNAAQWMKKLTCNLSSSEQNTIRNYLVQVCKHGCSDAYPYGKDQVVTGNPVSGPGTTLFYSFDDVINYYNTTFSSNCKTPVYPDPAYNQADCDCQKLSDYLNAYELVAPGTMTLTTAQAELIRDAINEDFGYSSGPNTYTATAEQVQAWYAECHGTGAPSHTYLVTNNFPSDLQCGASETLPEGPDNLKDALIAQCEEEALALKNYNIERDYEDKMEKKKKLYLDNLVNYCLNKAKEEFNMNYYLDEYLYTLYYYDQAGNLVKTVPPEGVEFLTSTADFAKVRDYRNNNLSNAYFLVPPHRMHTRYAYNTINSLIERETPDGSGAHFVPTGKPFRPTSYLYYDALGRSVCSQNEKQRQSSPRKFSYTLYDALGRAEQVGEVSDADVMAYAYDYMYNISRNLNGQNWNSWFSNVQSTREQVTYSYYDQPLSTTVSGYFGNGGQTNLRNRISSVTFEETFDNNAATYDHASHYDYDLMGNVRTLLQETPSLALLGQQLKRIDYAYDLMSGNVNRVSYQAGQPDQFYHEYLYDDDNRITHVFTSDDGFIWEKDAKYLYYAQWLQSRVELGDRQVQATDYAYTLHGWIKGVNSSDLNIYRDLGKDGHTPSTGSGQYAALHSNFGRDAYSYSLGYYAGDYKGISSIWQSGGSSNIQARFVGDVANSTLAGDYHDLYNGNISHMVAALTNVTEIALPVQGTAYLYDQLNRIMQAKSQQTFDAVSNTWSITNGSNGDYYEGFTYDFNGNIETVTRNGNLTGANQLMDNLGYNYYRDANNKKHNNLLFSVDDDIVPDGRYTTDVDDQGSFQGAINVVAANNNYQYDHIGNLVRDVEEEIDGIDWSVYGKIKEIRRTGTSDKSDLQFKYDAMGKRVLKIEKPRHQGVLSKQDEWTYTYYSRDASGNVMATYDRTIRPATGLPGTNPEKDLMVLKERMLYGSTRLGVNQQAVEMAYQTFDRVGYDNENGTVERGGTITTHISTYSEDLSRILGTKAYELTNHLGNVLTTVSDRKLSVETSSGSAILAYYVPDVLSATDYYAFGAPMPGRSFFPNSYRHGFNGKENDRETSTQDYGFRIYYPGIGRFLSVDPLTSSYPELTPYQFASNTPIESIDIDGLEQGSSHETTFKDKNGFEIKIKVTQSEQMSSANAMVQRAAKAATAPEPKVPPKDLGTMKNGDPNAEAVAIFHENMRRWGKYVWPYELTVKLFKGEEVSAKEWLIEGIGVIPVGKIFSKAGKYFLKYGDNLVDISTKAIQHKPCGCFTAGTQIYTEGGYKNIEEIKVGDIVWAYNDKTKELELKKVTDTFVLEFTQVFRIHFRNNVIEATHEHPFFIGGKWLKVDQLKVGDFLTLYDGTTTPITKIELVEGNFKVYNFTVEEFHTYYVSKQNVLVHNSVLAP